MLKGLDEVRDAARDRQHARRGEASLTVGSRATLRMDVRDLLVAPGGFILWTDYEGGWPIEGEVEEDPQSEAFTLVTGVPNSDQHAWLGDQTLFAFAPGSRIAVTRHHERLRFRFSGEGKLSSASSVTSVPCEFSGHCGADVSAD